MTGPGAGTDNGLGRGAAAHSRGARGAIGALLAVCAKNAPMPAGRGLLLRTQPSFVLQEALA